VTVRSEDRDGVRVLSLARPPVNALDFALVRARGAACESAAMRPARRSC
jgi:enoyl-CoA hydratase/carnithine racemase